MHIYHFDIHTKDWGGSKWKPRIVSVREGDMLEFVEGGEAVTLESVEGDAVRLVPVGLGPASTNKNGTIKLFTPFPPTTLHVGETVKVSTHSLDGGIYWKVTLFGITQEQAETDQHG
jgi:hypothetical protein